MRQFTKLLLFKVLFIAGFTTAAVLIFIQEWNNPEFLGTEKKTAAAYPLKSHAFEMRYASSDTRLFVDTFLTAGLNNGISRTNAFTKLQNALHLAESCNPILVAEGTYYPANAGKGERDWLAPEGILHILKI